MKITTAKHFIGCNRNFLHQLVQTVAVGQTNKTKGKNMKNKISIALAALALGASALVASAQDDNGGPPPGGGQGGPGMGHRPPPPLILKALDVNHDGVIDADEIANSPAAFKTLYANGEGKLTPN
jgi:hypothetical protein